MDISLYTLLIYYQFYALLIIIQMSQPLFLTLSPKSQKQNTSSKLQSYFTSPNYLNQQEQISMFIKNYPLIKYSSMSSINILIQTIIRQNQLLATKCQHNITLIKDMYLKHQQLISTNKQLLTSNKLLKSTPNNQSTVSLLLVQKDQSLKLTKWYDSVLSSTLQCNFKKTLQLLHKDAPQHQSLNISEMVAQAKEMKRRMKYHNKTHQIVQSFCGRINRVVESVPYDMLLQEMRKETSSLIAFLREIPHSNKVIAYQPFENLLKTVIVSGEQGKDRLFQEINELRREFEREKQNYEHKLSTTTLQSEKVRKNHQHMQQEKQNMAVYYQESIQKYKEQVDKLRKVIQQCKMQKNRLQEKEEEIGQLNKRVLALKKKLQVRQSQYAEELEQKNKSTLVKMQQKQCQIQSQIQQRKKQSLKYEQCIEQLKLKLANQSVKILSLSAQVTASNKLYDQLHTKYQALHTQFQQYKYSAQRLKQSLNSRLSQKQCLVMEMSEKVTHATNQLRRMQSSFDVDFRERSLKEQYTKELEYRAKELQREVSQLEKGSLERKREVTSLKGMLEESKMQGNEAETQLAKQREENKRIKKVLKEMKSNMEELYREVSMLKSVEGEREQLVRVVERGDQIQATLQKDCSVLRFEILKLQRENNRLNVQLKHAQNIVRRIQEIK